MGASCCNARADDLSPPRDVLAGISARFCQRNLDQHRRDLQGARDLINNLKTANAELEKRIEDLEQAISDAKIAQTAVKASLDVHRKLRELEQNTLAEAERALAKAEEKVKEARQKVAELNGKLKPVADFLADYDFIVAYLGHWKDDIDKAGAAFIGAGEEIASRIVEKSDESRLEPYQDWLNCWGPVLTAVPSEVPQTACTAKEEYEKLKEKLDAELNRIADQLGSFGWLLLPGVKLQQEFDKHVRKPLEQEVDKAIAKARHELIAFTSNQQLAFLVDSISSKVRVTADQLNEMFETDDSHQDLLTIANISQLVAMDAGLDGDDEEVEAERFNALFNAQQLSKLVLLGSSELNSLVQDLEGSAGVGRPPLFREDGQRFSLLLNAVRSIDGNEQWQRYALPYPRTENSDGKWPWEREYGRGKNEDGGFRLWSDQVARELVFKRLFRGPISPGIETHPVYTANFPFPACEAHPFPISTRDDNGQPNLSGDPTCRLLALSSDSGEPGQFGVLSTTPMRRRDLAGLSGWDLRVARNEVFARYGYRFGPPELVNYFSAQSWYHPSQKSPSQVNDMLTAVEWHNVMLIRRLESGKRIARPPTARANTIAAAR